MIKKYRLSTIISIILFLAVYSYLFYQLFFKTDIKEAFAIIAHLRFSYFLIGIFLSGLFAVTQGLLITEIFKLYQIKLSLKEGISTWLMTVPAGAVTAGFGGIAVLLYKARRKGCTNQFAAVITISYLVLVFSATLIYCLLFGGSALIQTAIKNNYSIIFSLLFIFLAILFSILLFNRKIRESIFHYVRRFFPNFLPKEETSKINELKNSQIADIFLYVLFVFLANFVIFAFSLFVFRTDLGFMATLKDFSITQAVSIISPSGSGLGFTELGMLGSLKYSNVPIHEAGAITIVFRLFNFWLPAILGWLLISHYGLGYFREMNKGKK